jgi:hypothetical protein
MAKPKGSNPVVKKVLDAVGTAVLGPKEDRGTVPADPRELDDKSNGGKQ